MKIVTAPLFLKCSLLYPTAQNKIQIINYSVTTQRIFYDERIRQSFKIIQKYLSEMTEENGKKVSWLHSSNTRVRGEQVACLFMFVHGVSTIYYANKK